jgi:hypothetical protein
MDSEWSVAASLRSRGATAHSGDVGMTTCRGGCQGAVGSPRARVSPVERERQRARWGAVRGAAHLDHVLDAVVAAVGLSLGRWEVGHQFVERAGSVLDAAVQLWAVSHATRCDESNRCCCALRQHQPHQLGPDGGGEDCHLAPPAVCIMQHHSLRNPLTCCMRVVCDPAHRIGPSTALDPLVQTPLRF